MTVAYDIAYQTNMKLHIVEEIDIYMRISLNFKLVYYFE